MKYIYMNEHIKEKDPSDPVIVVFDGVTKRGVYTNSVSIRDSNGVVVARVKFGTPPKFLSHHVKAWVEVYDWDSPSSPTLEFF